MFYCHPLCSPSLQLWRSFTVIISSYTGNCSLWYSWASLAPSLSSWLNGWWSAADETLIMTASNTWSQRECGNRRLVFVPYFNFFLQLAGSSAVVWKEQFCRIFIPFFFFHSLIFKNILNRFFKLCSTVIVLFLLGLDAHSLFFNIQIHSSHCWLL